ncbi:hypothetical protein CI784_14160 [Arthrobacter agilis]|nr:hypothetical protein [Arthrobacter agilis]OUM40629.1 hypothetical protein B8W74_14130 [Arthrobacter agilis]PPB45241.1 hypothetical protein CI784_14160 [Arthrobacter agilis]VDR31373.1 Uncharacterised protein [Arthrobacter agilis]
MYSENNGPVPDLRLLRSLEDSRAQLLDTMLSLRCDCAEVFADSRRSEDERDGAAWELARAVGDIRRCDEELHTLRELFRRQENGSTGRLIGTGSRR